MLFWCNYEHFKDLKTAPVNILLTGFFFPQQLKAVWDILTQAS